MKVTIIANGTNQIVLKPETPLENLVVKSLTDKALISKYHESTQILEASSPNCLVISPSKENKEVPSVDKWLAVISCNEQNKILGLIPSNTSSDGVLYFIREQLEADEIELLHQTTVTIDESFHTIITNSIDGKHGVSDQEFAVVNVKTYTK
jgi:hypothetical protein